MTRPDRLLLVAIAATLSIAFGACGSSAATTDIQATTELPTVTALPVEDTTPTATAKLSVNYFKPPGWDGTSDVDCTDFDTRANAQSFFKGTRGSKSNDPYRLDQDHDGLACETLP
jgi:hypothetical protein